MTKKILIPALLILLALAVGFVLMNGMYVPPQTQTVLSEREAIDAIYTQYPDLAAYETTDLPPSSVNAEQGPDGWYVAFVQRGSGVPGILNAKCYVVRHTREITAVGEYTKNSGETVEQISLATCTPTKIVETTQDSPDARPGLMLGKSTKFGSVTITPTRIEEDSRCPIGANCIQAGTVRVSILVATEAETILSSAELGKPFVQNGTEITLTEVTPEKQSGTNIEPEEYRFIFEEKADTSSAVCYRSGCSGQLCTDEPGMVSTCEFKQEYACYQNAVCARQADGQCGWTETPELRACIADSEEPTPVLE